MPTVVYLLVGGEKKTRGDEVDCVDIIVRCELCWCFNNSQRTLSQILSNNPNIMRQYIYYCSTVDNVSLTMIAAQSSLSSLFLTRARTHTHTISVAILECYVACCCDFRLGSTLVGHSLNLPCLPCLVSGKLWAGCSQDRSQQLTTFLSDVSCMLPGHPARDTRTTIIS